MRERKRVFNGVARPRKHFRATPVRESPMALRAAKSDENAPATEPRP